MVKYYILDMTQVCTRENKGWSNTIAYGKMSSVHITPERPSGHGGSTKGSRKITKMRRKKYIVP